MEIKQLEIGKVRPNGYNPNLMERTEFDELIAEVRHLGRLPKPVVVRQNGDGFEIIDGEHGWRAAKEVGLETVPCEVVEADDFESMRQTWKRNQHGKHHPVLEGRMFRQMMEERNLSRRQLARNIEVSEGTIRNALLWAEAADLRNGYAPGEDVRFESLTIRQVRFALREMLPAVLWDRWMDDGGKPFEPPQDTTSRDVFEWAGEHGFLPYFERHGINDKTLKAMDELEDFSSGVMQEWIPNLLEYIRPVMCILDLTDPDKVWNETLRFVENRGEKPLSIPYEPEQYVDIVRASSERYSDDAQVIALVDVSLDTMFKREGWTKYDEANPFIIETRKAIEVGPAVIRENRLDANEKRVLLDVFGELQERYGISIDDATEIVAAAIERIEYRQAAMLGYRYSKSMASPREPSEMERELGITFDNPLDHELETDPREVVGEILRQRAVEEGIEVSLELISNRDAILNAFLERMERYYLIREGTFEGRPVGEILRERLSAIPEPETVLLVGMLLDNSAAVARWRELCCPEQIEADDEHDEDHQDDTPHVVNINTCENGWNTDPQYVYIGRENLRRKLPESPFHNPFQVGKDGDRDRCIALFREHFESNAELQEMALEQLAGKTLVCFCKPEACHGDVIVEFLQRRNEKSRQGNG